MPTHRRTRKQSGGKQSGGSRRWLSLPTVTNPRTMVENVDIQYVFAHGTNLTDTFIVVPENTFIYYVGKSGYKALLTTGHKFASHETYNLYRHFFTDTEPKPLAPYPTAHIYVPGDILPLSNLYFMDGEEDSVYYTWPKGVYRKPFTPSMNSYLEGQGVKTIMHIEDVDTLARLYPTAPRLVLRDELEMPSMDPAVPAHVTPKTRAQLYDALIAHDSVDERQDYIALLMFWYGFDTAVYSPEFWFRNPEAIREIHRLKEYNMEGNQLKRAYPEPPYGISINDVLDAVPSDRQYRLVILNSCRSPYVTGSLEKPLVRLAERLSSASKQEGVMCVTSETRSPVLNLATLRLAYEHLIALYERLKPVLDAGPQAFTNLWRLQSQFFEKEKFGRRLTGRLLYKRQLPAEAISNAMTILRKWSEDDTVAATSIPDEGIRNAILDTIEKLHATFTPLVSRIEREFGQLNRRKAPETQFLTMTTRMTKKAYRNTKRQTRRANATGNHA